MKYLFAYTIPIAAIIGIYLGGLYTFSAFAYAFVLIPLIELLLPSQDVNPHKPQYNNTQNLVFDILLYLNVPIVYGSLLYSLFKLSISSITAIETVGIILSLGVVLGSNGINVAHELGHRPRMFEKILSKILLLPSFYTHFFIEHNHGHHLHVATPEDPSTAKLNQNLYQFWIQSVAGTYMKAWKIQRKLNKDNNISTFNFKNDMLYFMIIQLLYLVALYFSFGLTITVYAILAGIVGLLLLETINYIEHYGLLRNKLPSGRYERVTEQHSWNSNHTIGRIVLYELTRHSDHHFKSQKKYQTLTNHATSPQLPYGYPTSMVLAFFPPLWFKIMNKRLTQKVLTA